MSDLKSQIFKLIKKHPNTVNSWNDNAYIIYHTDTADYQINLYKKQDYHPSDYPLYSICLNISIQNSDIFGNDYSETIPVTEKEFMELKWKFEEWQDILREEAFNKFKEFVEPDEPSVMDDLLND